MSFLHRRICRGSSQGEVRLSSLRKTMPATRHCLSGPSRKLSRGHCCVEVGPRFFPPRVQFDLGHFSNHMWDVVVSQSSWSPRIPNRRRGFRNECPPGEFAGRQRGQPLAREVGSRVFISATWGCHLPSGGKNHGILLIEVGSLDLGRGRPEFVLTNRKLTQRRGPAENQSGHFLP